MIFQTYAGLDTVNATSDLSNIFVYLNSITNNAAMPGMLFAFYIIVLLAGYFMDTRFGRPRFPVSFTVAGFTTFGLATIMSLKNGLLNPVYTMIAFALSMVGVIWLYITQENQY